MKRRRRRTPDVDVEVDVEESYCEDKCDLTGGGKRRTSDITTNVGRRILLQTSDGGRFWYYANLP